MNKDSRESNTIRNFTVGTLNQVLLLLLNLISKSVFIKNLGPVFMGVNGLFTNIFLLLSFAEFGIGSVMVYSLYAPISKEDKGEIRAVYYLFRKIYMILNGAIVIAGILVIPLLAFIVKTDQAIPHLTGYYVLYLVGIVISNIFMYNSHLILADQKKYILSLYGLVFEGIAMIVQVVFLLTTQNYGIYLAIFIIKNALYALATSLKVRKLYPFLNTRSKVQEIGKKEKRKIYNRIVDVFSYKFARVFITGTDNILISMLVGTIWVGYYSNYDLIIMGVMSLVDIFYSGISASIGNLIAKETKKDQYDIFETVILLNMWIVGFTTTSLYILFQDFISLWLGQQYLMDFRIVILIIFNFYIVCNRQSISLFREASGMFNKIKYAMFVGAGLNLVLSVVLGKLLGISGVFLGTIISALTTYYWYEARLLLKEKFSSSMVVFFKSQGESLIYLCLSILLTSLAVSWINIVTIETFIIKLAICLVVPNGFYFFILRRRSPFKLVVDMGLKYYRQIKSRWENG